jgi:hypothetical protein
LIAAGNLIVSSRSDDLNHWSIGSYDKAWEPVERECFICVVELPFVRNHALSARKIFLTIRAERGYSDSQVKVNLLELDLPGLDLPGQRSTLIASRSEHEWRTLPNQ